MASVVRCGTYKGIRCPRVRIVSWTDDDDNDVNAGIFINMRGLFLNEKEIDINTPSGLDYYFCVVNYSYKDYQYGSSFFCFVVCS